MKAYVVASTKAQFLDALRLLQLNERAAVHVTPGQVVKVDGPVFIYENGRVNTDEVAHRAA